MGTCYFLNVVISLASVMETHIIKNIIRLNRDDITYVQKTFLMLVL